MQNNKNIILYIGSVPELAIQNIRNWAKKVDQTMRVALIYDTRKQKKPIPSISDELDLVLSCDFSSSSAIQKTLQPYLDEFLAVTARAEKNIP